jgi:hypothetical protein
VNGFRNEVMMKELQLPPSKTATAQEMFEIMRRRVPGFSLPSLTKKKATKKDDKNAKKKK